MKGKEFKKVVEHIKETTGHPIHKIAENSKIYLRTLWLQFKRTDDVPDEYFEQLKKGGYKIPESVEPVHGPDAQLMNDMLKLIRENQKEFQKSNERLEKTNAVLIKNNSVLLANQNAILKFIEQSNPKGVKQLKKEIKPLTH